MIRHSDLTILAGVIDGACEAVREFVGESTKGTGEKALHLVDVLSSQPLDVSLARRVARSTLCDLLGMLPLLSVHVGRREYRAAERAIALSVSMLDLVDSIAGAA